MKGLAEPHFNPNNLITRLKITVGLRLGTVSDAPEVPVTNHLVTVTAWM